MVSAEDAAMNFIKKKYGVTEVLTRDEAQLLKDIGFSEKSNYNDFRHNLLSKINAPDYYYGSVNLSDFSLTKDQIKQEIGARNDWDTLGDNDSPLINGTIGCATNIFPTKIYLPPIYGGTADMYNLTFTSEVNEEYSNLTIDKSMFVSEVPFVDNKTKYKIMHSRFKDSIPNEFTYGYCITAHKAQGSQWNKVLVYEEGFPFVKDEHKRWLYTACTRAIDKLVILH